MITIGNKETERIRINHTDVSAAYLGASKVWEGFIPVFRKKVIEDGGTFMEEIFRSELARQIPLLRREPISLLIPGAYKAGVVYAMNTLTGDPVPITFSRASTASYIDENGAMQIAATNIPRIDYSRGYPAYLLERSSTNFDNRSNAGFLSNGGAVFTPDAETHKGVSYTSFVGASETEHIKEGVIIPGGNSNITVSFFLKDVSGGGVKRINVSGTPGGEKTIIFNTVSGTVINSGGYSLSLKMVDLGDGFKRVSITITGFDGTTVYSLYGVGSFLVANFQIEPARFATSPIYTSGSQVTRAGDLLVAGPIKKGASETSVYMEAEVAHQVTPGNSFYFSSRGVGIDGTWWQRNTADQIMSYNDGVIAQNEYYIENGVNKIATSIKYGGAWKLSANGSPVVSSPIGSTFGTQEEINVDVSTTIMHLRTFGVLHRQLTDQEHVELTQP